MLECWVTTKETPSASGKTSFSVTPAAESAIKSNLREAHSLNTQMPHSIDIWLRDI
jgi:hypothetical protein